MLIRLKTKQAIWSCEQWYQKVFQINRLLSNKESKGNDYTEKLLQTTLVFKILRSRKEMTLYGFSFTDDNASYI